MGSTKKYKLGIAAGIGSGVLGGLDAIIVAIVLGFAIFTYNPKAVFFAPLVVLFMEDAVSTIYMTILNLANKSFGLVIKGVRTKSGLFIILGAIFGGPFGMICYLLSIQCVGPFIPASISAIYPALGAILAYVFLKHKIKGITAIGIFFSITGVVILGFSGGSIVGGNYALGVLFAVGAALGWALESVVCAYGMSKNIPPTVAINIRYFISCLATGAIILSIRDARILAADAIKSNLLWLIILSALTVATGYLLYYMAIYRVGTAKATALNITYALFAGIFQIIILHTSISVLLFVGCIVVTAGSILVVLKPDDIMRNKLIMKY